LPVHDIGLDHALRRLHPTAMGRQEDFVVAREQPFQRNEKPRHVAFRRGDDGGVPAHYMIAGKHGALSDERKTKMIRRMTRRVQNVERDAANLHHIAIL